MDIDKLVDGRSYTMAHTLNDPNCFMRVEMPPRSLSANRPAAGAQHAPRPD
jgi:hypothetical protein